MRQAKRLIRKPGLYTVKRLVLEEYEVEKLTDEPMTRNDFGAMAEDPYAVTVIRETIVRRKSHAAD